MCETLKEGKRFGDYGDGFEEPQVINTEGERYKKRRTGVRILERDGQGGGIEGGEGEGQRKSRGNVGYEMM
jgi:hypothetical protein